MGRGISPALGIDRMVQGSSAFPHDAFAASPLRPQSVNDDFRAAKAPQRKAAETAALGRVTSKSAVLPGSSDETPRTRSVGDERGSTGEADLPAVSVAAKVDVREGGRSLEDEVGTVTEKQGHVLDGDVGEGSGHIVGSEEVRIVHSHQPHRIAVSSVDPDRLVEEIAQPQGLERLDHIQRVVIAQNRISTATTVAKDGDERLQFPKRALHGAAGVETQIARDDGQVEFEIAAARGQDLPESRRTVDVEIREMKDLHSFEAGGESHKPKVVLHDVDPGRSTCQGFVKTTEIQPTPKPRHHRIEDLEREKLLPVPHALGAPFPAPPTGSQMDSQAILGTAGKLHSGVFMCQQRMHGSDILSALDGRACSPPPFLCRRTGARGVRMGLQGMIAAAPHRGLRAPQNARLRNTPFRRRRNGMIRSIRSLWLGVFLALTVVVASASAQESAGSDEITLKYKPCPKWNYILPHEVFTPVGDKIAIPHAAGDGFAVAMDGTTLLLDANGDGRLGDAKAKGAGAWVTLKSKTEDGRKLFYSLRLVNDGGWKYASSGVMVGKYKGVPIQLIDQNNNGRYNDVGEDAVIVGKSRAASFLSKVVSLKGELFEVEVSPTGNAMTFRPYQGPSGVLDLRSKFATKGKLVAAVVMSEDGEFSFEVSKAKKGLVVPTGAYEIVAGLVTKGREHVSIRKGKSRVFRVLEGQSSAVAWGGPLEAEFEYDRKGKDVTFSPNKLWFFGRAGEEYYNWVPDGKPPKFIIADGVTAKKIGEAKFGGC